MLIGFALISTKVNVVNGQNVFQDSHQSSSEAERPLGLILGKETIDLCEKLMKFFLGRDVTNPWQGHGCFMLGFQRSF
jgi:hypothetical protein